MKRFHFSPYNTSCETRPTEKEGKHKKLKMTYYIGILLKDKTIIAADKRVTIQEGNVVKVRDNFPKIGKISQYAYFSGAGSMNACGEVFKYLKDNNLKFPEDALQVDLGKIRDIYAKNIQQAREEIPDFEKEKETHGYLNLSMIVGGISKEKEPIIIYMNNLDDFIPKIITGCAAGTATNMSSEANQMTGNFFREVTRTTERLNQNPESMMNLFRELFKGISEKEDSVSPTFDVMTVNSRGEDTLKGYGGI